MAVLLAIVTVAISLVKWEPLSIAWNSTIGSSRKAISAFSFPNIWCSTEIEGESIRIEMPTGVTWGALTPAISVAEGVTVTRPAGVPADFSGPVTYVVKAENESERTYPITVTTKSAENEARSIAINGKSVALKHSDKWRSVVAPYDADLAKLDVTFGVSDTTQVAKAIRGRQDFSQLRENNVVAWDSNTARYHGEIERSKWRLVTREAPFTPRDGAGLLAFKDRLWLLGGWDGTKTISEVWSSSDGRNWELVTPEAPWEPRHCAGWAVHAGKMWVIGGDMHDDVWSSNDGKHWACVKSNAPWGRRYSPYVVAYDGKLWLMGGQGWYPGIWCHSVPHCTTRGYNDVWMSRDGYNWVRVVEHATWGPRALIHGSATMNGRMWIIGGGLKGAPPYERYLETQVEYRDVWSSTDGRNWQLEANEVEWQGRTHFSIAVHDGKLWITDGSVGKQANLSNEAWFSTDGKHWAQLAETGWPPRHASALASFQGSLFLVSGFLTNDVWAMAAIP